MQISIARDTNELIYTCDYCNSDELVFSQILSDYRCQDCGKWDDGE